MELEKARNMLTMITETCLAPRTNNKGSAFIIKPSSRTLEEKGIGDYKIGIDAAMIQGAKLSCIDAILKKNELHYMWTFNVADRILLIYTPKE